MKPRGTFVVFEGVDRAGKSTQCKLLAEGLRKRGREATLINFPDRTTGVGQLIDKYLRKEVELDDRAVHLMFSANRWEAAQSIKDMLESGVDVVCDRYAFSAVWKSTSVSGAPDNSSLSHFSAMTLPCWLGRVVRNRHRHAIEQASR